MCFSLDQRTEPLRLLIHDRDPEFSGAFDEVFSTEGIEIIKTPIRSPRANAVAERWIRAVRAECLDWLLIAGERHLHRVLRTYADHYNRQRPHRGLDLQAPEIPPTRSPETSPSSRVRRWDRLGVSSMSTGWQPDQARCLFRTLQPEDQRPSVLRRRGCS